MAGEMLVVVTGPAAGLRITVDGELVLGRAEEGDGSLGNDSMLSRRHAVVRMSPNGLTIEDLGSTNGTMVNGHRITATTTLIPGDRIELGGSSLTVEADIAQPVVAAAAPARAAAPAAAPFQSPPVQRRVASRPGTPNWVVVVAALVIIAVVVATRGGSSSTTQHLTPGVDGTAYIETNVAAAGQNSVLAVRYHGGSLRPIEVTEYRTGGSGSADLDNRGVLDADQQVITNDDGTLLFAINQGSDTIAVFRIADDGTLTPVRGSPFPSGGTAPGSLGISGKVLIVANKAHDGVRELGSVAPNYTTMLVDDDGVLHPTGHTVTSTPKASPTQVYVAPGGNLVFATEETGATRAFTIDQSGNIAEAPSSPLALPDTLFNTGKPRPNPVWPAGLSVNPKAPVLYSGVPNYNSIVAFDYGSDGHMTVDGGVADPDAVLPCWSVVSSDGKRLYFANAGSDNISVFDVDTDPRRPQLMQTVQLRGGGNPWNLVLDSAGTQLYIITPRQVKEIPAGQGQLLHSLTVAADGTLTEMPDSPLPLPVAFGSNPLGLAIVAAR